MGRAIIHPVARSLHLKLCQRVTNQCRLGGLVGFTSGNQITQDSWRKGTERVYIWPRRGEGRPNCRDLDGFPDLYVLLQPLFDSSVSLAHK